MDLKKSMRCQEDVALNITKHLFSKEDYHKKNLIFSPLSLHVVLSVMAAGSAGSTLDELLSFLRFDSMDHLTTFFSQVISPVLFSEDRLCFANGMWADESLSLSHSFKQLVATHYKATLASVDFKTKGDQVHHEVNSWVEKETNGLITHLLPPSTINNLTKLVFANLLSFEGEWKHKFPAIPIKYNFHLFSGTSITAPFMKSMQKKHFISAFDDFKVVRLSYRQGGDKSRRFSMYIFLPDAKYGLLALIEKLASEPRFLKGKFPRRKVQVRDFFIPKFKISFTFEASNVMKELGLILPFSHRDVNFSKMVGEMNSHLDKLCVESVFHKAFIEVNEKGTVASAATLPLALRGSRPVTSIDFVADHPFLFLIREDFNGTILFIGQVINPLDGADASATPVKFRKPNI
ncbi:serpin-ZX-like [Lotus japonicus]|uniref:serpin-ZX-like n=1 Tax=Lotus japonicus TaxID=34305 RepID=UPI00258861C2|nr:serpin-ZX-like [Lotus japonicus]